MEIKILVVSDESDSLKLLYSDLQSCCDFDVKGSDFNAKEIKSLLRNFDPDTVVINVQDMGNKGIKLVFQALSLHENIPILFLIPDEKNLIEQVKRNGFTYLVKPVGSDDLKKTIFEIYEYTRHNAVSDDSLCLLAEIRKSNKIRFNNMNGFILLKPSEILYAEADGNYSKILLTNGNVEITSQNLLCLEKKLAGSNFIRLSRSYLINIEYLAGIDRRKKQCILKYSNTNITLPIPADRLKEICRSL